MLKKILITFASIILTGLIGYADYFTGQQILLTIFYLVPVVITVWYTELIYGFLISGISSAVWYFLEKNTGMEYESAGVLLWDTFVLFLFLLLVAFLLNTIKEFIKKEKTTARTDYLTQMANARYFTEQLEIEMNRSLRENESFAVAYMDCDNFKHVNDVFGHSAGDRVLQITSDVLKGYIRKMDLAARLGGDEFAVLFPMVKMKDAELLLKNLKENLNRAMEKNGYPVTFSIGAVVFTKIPGSTDEILKKADNLMYEVKKSGKNSLKLAEY